MIIQHNLSAINAHRQMGINNSNITKSLEKLSSGYRINKAGDDAAGLAISEKMRGQITGLGQAVRNSQDGISLLQTAEGALNETHSILQRMRELSVQSANGTYDDTTDRKQINKEMESLKAEIDRISTSTEFNGKKLLDGSMGGTVVTGNDVTVDGTKFTFQTEGWDKPGTTAKEVDVATKAGTTVKDQKKSVTAAVTAGTITLTFNQAIGSAGGAADGIETSFSADEINDAIAKAIAEKGTTALNVSSLKIDKGIT
ncbi:MAG: hypothetical protein RR540_03310, partial [Oscillospiraceae bacterium]